ncbi:MAG: MerC domain-containing protein [Myxococcota bacterium]
MADSDAKTANTQVDAVGAVCSSLCAVHCATAALAPSVLVALGLGAALGPTLEWGFTAVAVVIGAASAWIGWKRGRARWILMVLVAGVLGLSAGRLLEAIDLHHVGAGMSIAAGLALAVGHVSGIRARLGHTAKPG